MKRLESRADEILSKLGRIDRMLDHVVEGIADCPRLFVLTPATDCQAVGSVPKCGRGVILVVSVMNYFRVLLP